MKKTIVILLITLFVSSTSFAHEVSSSVDDIEQYTASNGITYRVGDVIQTKKGSMRANRFRYIYWGSLISGDGNTSGTLKSLTIKEIKRIRTPFERDLEVIFIVKGDDFMTYSLRVDKAIGACEIYPCGSYRGALGGGCDDFLPNESRCRKSNSNLSVADELAKMKVLEEEGIITRLEYKGYSRRLLNDGLPEVSAADELRKLKKLFDGGRIDQWQYKAFKARLIYEL